MHGEGTTPIKREALTACCAVCSRMPDGKEIATPPPGDPYRYRIPHLQARSQGGESTSCPPPTLQVEPCIP